MANAISHLGWIGLGNMGLAMAANLQRHLQGQGLPPLQVWNRTACKADAVTALGATQCASIAEVVRRSDIIFISTSNDEALQSIVAQIIATGSLTDKIIVDTTTVHPDTTKAVSAHLAQQKASMVSAPILGSAPMAAERKILVVAAGARSTITRVSPYIKGVIARDMLHVASEAEKASLLKLIGNFLVSGLTEIIGEAHVLAEKSQLESEVLENLLDVQFGPLFAMISRRLTQGVYMPPRGQAPWSSLDLALKDVGHAMDCAAAAGARLAVGEVMLDHLQRAKAFSEVEDRQLDSAALYGVVRQEAGLDFESAEVKRRDA